MSVYYFFSVGCSAVINKITHHIQENSETQNTRVDIFTLDLIVFIKNNRNILGNVSYVHGGTSMLKSKELKQGCVKE